MSRGGNKISRVSGEKEFERSDSPDWLNDFAKVLAKEGPKTAVEVARERNQLTLLDQLNSVMNRKSKHSTVDSIVNEMRERTGLNGYLQTLSSQNTEASLKKNLNSVAQEAPQELATQTPPKAPAQPPKFPSSLAKYKSAAGSIDTFIQRIVSKYSGAGITIPQVQYDIVRAFGPKFNVQPNDVWNAEVAAYINHLITIAQSSSIKHEFNPAVNDGAEQQGPDQNNSDAFAILNPAKV